MKAPTNKPKAPSKTAGYAPTEHSKTVEERLGELRADLESERRRRRSLRANTVAIFIGALIVAAEISVTATEVIAHRRTLTAVMFATSSAIALLGVLFALERLARMSDSSDLVTRKCRYLIALASVVGAAGAFIAAWPS